MEPRVTAVYDANVLYPAPLRDLFIRLAQAGLVRGRWSETIHEEWFRNVLNDNPQLSAGRLARTRALMNEAVRDCMVTGYEELIDALTLPDPHDRHVLAAAIRAGAEVIVTFNLKRLSGRHAGPFRHRGATPGRLSLCLFSICLQLWFRAAIKRQRGESSQPTPDRSGNACHV